MSWKSFSFFLRKFLRSALDVIHQIYTEMIFLLAGVKQVLFISHSELIVISHVDTGMKMCKANIRFGFLTQNFFLCLLFRNYLSVSLVEVSVCVWGISWLTHIIAVYLSSDISPSHSRWIIRDEGARNVSRCTWFLLCGCSRLQSPVLQSFLFLETETRIQASVDTMIIKDMLSFPLWVSVKLSRESLSNDFVMRFNF